MNLMKLSRKKLGLALLADIMDNPASSLGVWVLSVAANTVQLISRPRPLLYLILVSGISVAADQVS